MSQPVIKSLTPCVCPSCGKDIIIDFSINPSLSSVYTVEDVEKAKLDAIERIKTLSIDEDKKLGAIEWLKNEENIVGPNDVDSIVNSLLSPDN